MEEEREARFRSTAARTKTFGDAMRSAAIRMREEPLDAIPFFENVERLFATLEVPVELQADLIRPYLSDRANRLVSQLEPSATRDYTVVKRYILSQLRLSPRVLLDKFNTLVRGAEETTVLFASRLKALLQYYLDSRKVKTFKDLFSLIVSDRIKSTLAEGCLNHVLSVESNTDGGWLSYDKLSDVIDTYYANRVDGKPVVAAIGYNGKNRQRGHEGQGFRNDKSVVEQTVTDKGLSAKSVKARDASYMPGTAGKSCWSCGGPHLKKNCPTIGQSGDRSGYRAAGAQSRVETAKPVRFNQVVIDTGAAVDGGAIVTSSQCVVSCPVKGAEAAQGFARAGSISGNETGGSASMGDREYAENEPVCESRYTGKSEFRPNSCDSPVLGNVCQGLSSSDMSPLRYVNLIVTEIPNRVIRSLNDSGSQLTIVNKKVLDGYQYPVCGVVKVRGLFGSPVDAELSHITLAMSDDTRCAVRVMCAVSDLIHEELIVPADVVDSLNDRYNQYLSTEVRSDCASLSHFSENASCDNGTENDVARPCNKTDEVVVHNSPIIDDNATTSPNSDDESFLDVESVENNLIDHSVASVSDLQREQLADDTLKGCWQMAKCGKGQFFIKDDLLFHHEKVCGQTIEGLVVPKGRRNHVLDIAHSVTGGHFNYRKTRDRIKLSGLTWSTLTRDCKDWVQRCSTCQKMSRTTCYDRIPIHAIPRSPSLFAHFFCDVFGPVMPDQNIRYNYCLVLVDSHSLWVSAYPLRNLTAKSICLALINMFSYTGLSSEVTVMSSDNASYFKAELTREFLKRIGVSPRFHTPHASWSTGLVERHLQTVKRILEKLAVDHPKQWWEYLPFTLWAMRESVSNPLQVQPFMMVTGGRCMRGPLTILKDSWLGFRNLPVSLGKRTEEFLKEVKQGLGAAQLYADEHTRLAQQRYVHHYNLRARPKRFEIGQQCLIWQTDSTSSRMFARLKGLAKIVDAKYSDSYVVELDGKQYHLHANHLRPYFVNVDSVTCSAVEVQRLVDVCDDLDARACAGKLCDDLGDVLSVTSDYCSIVYE
jgi:hypothetical protein